MTIKDNKVDDGYTGFLLNPDTGQVLRANAHLNEDPFYIRVDSANPGKVARVSTSRPAPVKQHLRLKDEPEEPVIEPTPEIEVSVDEDSAELALISLQAEVEACNDKSALKGIGETLGLKLTKSMNASTMQERITTQIGEIRSASEGE